MLYKNKADSRYYLVITKENVPSKDFNRVCNILSEYGTKEPSYDNALGFFTEHCECIISRHALHVLNRL